nr:hypothetical protein [uncultured Desulfobacter sp.]
MDKKYFTAMILILSAAFMVFCGCYPKRVGPIGPEGKQLTWEEMDLSRRKDHMRQKVLPVAADVFGTWQPKRFAQIDCRLCHAQGETQGIYDMPTANLPRLSGALLLGPEFERAPETTRLKLDRLVPEMSAALGVKPFSIITRRGFGCYSCHLGPNGAMFGN